VRSSASSAALSLAIHWAGFGLDKQGHGWQDDLSHTDPIMCDVSICYTILLHLQIGIVGPAGGQQLQDAI
jgi:hypothetical protein